VRIAVVGEDALLVTLGDAADIATLSRVRAAVAVIEATLGTALVDLVPSCASVLVVYDTARTDYATARRQLRGALVNLPADARQVGETVVLPVYYAPEAGADLEALAARAGLAVNDVIDLHAGGEYRVYAIGFAPGFAYLGEVDARIAAPRLATPRADVPRGSVAIADRQTAVYPRPSPGGWNLIGRCPVHLFDPHAKPPCPLAVGDRVRFEPIDRARYLDLGGELP